MQYWVAWVVVDNYAHYQGADSSLQGHSSARHLLPRPSSYIAPVIGQSDHFILIVRLLGSRIQGKPSDHLHCLDDNVQVV